MNIALCPLESVPLQARRRRALQRLCRSPSFEHSPMFERTFIALQLPEGALMNDAVIMKAVPVPPPEESPTVWQSIPFKANTSRPGGLKKSHVFVLIAASVLIHGAVWW
ncbi:Ferric siderophore ABC transporter substrate-binding protein, partial [Pseudomonas viridiflava]